MTSHPASGRLERRLASIDLPPPRQVALVSARGEERRFRLRFPPGARLAAAELVQLASDGVREPVRVAPAALALARAADLAVPEEHHAWAPDADLPVRTLLFPTPEGASARELLVARPALAPAVYRALGRALAAIGEVAWPRTGSRVVPGLGFVPRRATWGEEILCVAEHALRLARARGADAGPLSDALLARIERARPALDEVVDGRLVHGDLRPANLWVAPDGEDARITAIVDWTDALVGDPLLDVVVLLGASRAALGFVAEGVGDVGGWLDPAALARLDAYRGVQALLAASRGRLDDAVALATRSVEDDVRVALGEAVPAPRPIDPRDALRRRALAALAVLPTPTPADLARIAAALARIELGDVPVVSLPSDGIAPWEPIRDRAAHAEALRSATGGQPLARALAWLGLEAVHALGGAVSDAVLRGLEGAIRALAVRGPASRAQDRLADALLAVAAGSAGVDALVEPCDALFLLPTDEPLEDWPPADWSPTSEAEALLAPARLALVRLHGSALPASPSAIWRALQPGGGASDRAAAS